MHIPRSILLLILSFLLFPACPLFAQYGASKEQAAVIDAWIQAKKDKLPKWLQGVPRSRRVDKNPSFYKSWGVLRGKDKAVKEGVPLLSGTIPLTGFQRAAAAGVTLVYAQYGASAREASQELFIRLPNKGLKRLFHLGLCSDFSVLQMGKKAPQWVLAHDSDCRNGFTDYIHGIRKDGKLKLLLKLECRTLGWKALDLDHDGFKEIIHTVGYQGFPPDLKRALEKAGVYKEPKGSVLQRVEILQWKGGGFRKVGEYFERGEAW